MYVIWGGGLMYVIWGEGVNVRDMCNTTSVSPWTYIQSFSQNLKNEVCLNPTCIYC